MFQIYVNKKRQRVKHELMVHLEVWTRFPLPLKLILILALLCYVYHSIHQFRRTELAVIILYNRVPKCGSSLMNALLHYLANEKGTFKFIQSTDYDQYRLSRNEQEALRSDLLDQSEQTYHRTVLYERHFHFVHFTSCEKNLFFYINQIRDPLKRALSYYDYVRYVCTVHGPTGACLLAHRSLLNLTMEDCVRTGDPARCLTKPYGVRSSISFFCGQAAICDDATGQPNTEKALALAKHNIERYYAHINVLEYIENSLELLEYNHPVIFGGITDIYRVTLNRSLVHETPREYRHPISERTRAILRNLLKHEYELYDFVKQRFIAQYTQAFQRAPLPTRK